MLANRTPTALRNGRFGRARLQGLGRDGASTIHSVSLAKGPNGAVGNYNLVPLATSHDDKDELSQAVLNLLPVLASQDRVLFDELPGSIEDFRRESSSVRGELVTQMHSILPQHALPARFTADDSRLSRDFFTFFVSPKFASGTKDPQTKNAIASSVTSLLSATRRIRTFGSH
jgi:hypothetical protein